MRSNYKSPEADLRKYYIIFFEMSLIVVLLTALIVAKLDFRSNEKTVDLNEEQKVVKMEEIVQTEHQNTPPPPPRPPVPVEVPDDEVIEDQILNIDAELNLDQELEMPPPPQEEEEEDFFVIVEKMPKIKGGLVSIQQCVEYPEMARKAGIEGRVIVQFIVNENGEVEENPKVVRGIGGGADEEALRCVKRAEFTPGMQRGEPVRVQFTVPVVYNLSG